jgi:hypothetical protein
MTTKPTNPIRRLDSDPQPARPAMRIDPVGGTRRAGPSLSWWLRH